MASKKGLKMVGIRGKTLHGQSRQILCNLVDYFKREKEAGGPVSSIKNVMNRACEASGVSESTLRRSLKERTLAETNCVSMTTPGQNRKRDAYVTNVKRSDIVALRAIIRKFYLDGKVPSLKKILTLARRTLKYQGGLSSLSRIVKTKLGYHYASLTKGGAKYLIEKDDIAVLRRQFLRKIRAFQAKSRSIVYLDETWINERNSPSTCWQDAQGRGGLCYPASEKGERLVVIFAGTADGFVPNARFIFAAANANGESGQDFSSDLTADVFGKWFEQQFLPNVPVNSVIVLDNAACHSEELHSLPTSKSKRSDMVEWLASNGIRFDETMVKAELYSLVKQSNGEKTGSSRYLIDELAQLKGHTVLRLPNYFTDFNPIDQIWSQVQSGITERTAGGALPLPTMRVVLEEELDKIGCSDWRVAVEKATALQDQFWKEDDLIDQQIEKLRNLTGRPKGVTSVESSDDEGESEEAEEEVEERQVTVEKQDSADINTIAEFCSADMMWGHVNCN